LPHVFRFGNIGVLESSDRLGWQPLEPFIMVLLDTLQESERKIACEIGSGAGYFTISLAKIFEKIYAVDINESMIDYLKDKAKKYRLENINYIISANPPKIEEKFNLIHFGLVLHELEKPQDYLNWALKKTELITIIDWKKEDTGDGPPINERISEKEVEIVLRESGFDVKSFRVYSKHYFLIGENSNPQI
jgi:tRNA G37 N-methylase Trm5